MTTWLKFTYCYFIHQKPVTNTYNSIAHTVTVPLPPLSSLNFICLTLPWILFNQSIKLSYIICQVHPCTETMIACQTSTNHNFFTSLQWFPYYFKPLSKLRVAIVLWLHYNTFFFESQHQSYCINSRKHEQKPEVHPPTNKNQHKNQLL